MLRNMTHRFALSIFFLSVIAVTTACETKTKSSDVNELSEDARRFAELQVEGELALLSGDIRSAQLDSVDPDLEAVGKVIESRIKRIAELVKGSQGNSILTGMGLDDRAMYDEVSDPTNEIVWQSLGSSNPFDIKELLDGQELYQVPTTTGMSELGRSSYFPQDKDRILSARFKKQNFVSIDKTAIRNEDVLNGFLAIKRAPASLGGISMATLLCARGTSVKRVDAAFHTVALRFFKGPNPDETPGLDVRNKLNGGLPTADLVKSECAGAEIGLRQKGQDARADTQLLVAAAFRLGSVRYRILNAVASLTVMDKNIGNSIASGTGNHQSFSSWWLQKEVAPVTTNSYPDMR